MHRLLSLARDPKAGLRCVTAVSQNSIIVAQRDVTPTDRLFTILVYMYVGKREHQQIKLFSRGNSGLGLLCIVVEAGGEMINYLADFAKRAAVRLAVVRQKNSQASASP